MGLRSSAACLAAALAVAAVPAAPANGSGAGCAPVPDPGTVPWQVSAVHAEAIAPPPTTPAIAVLDSGVDPAAPGLGGRVRPGLNVVSPASGTDDAEGHGTAVAAVAAGAGDARGVSPTSPIIPITIFDARGETRVSWIVKGIAAALARHAGVINISAAGPSRGPLTHDDRVVQRAIDGAVSRGTVVVVSTGNEGLGRLDAPARYAHVIAVGATDESGEPADFSNRGAGLDVVAPGSGLITAAPATRCATGFQIVSGTSFAAPAVAGAAALAQALHPGIDVAALTDLLRSPVPNSPWSPDRGFGLLDVAAVLAAPVPPGDAGEADDDIGLVQGAPALRLASHRGTALDDRVSAHTDPADVFRVRLRRGDRFVAAVKSTPRARLQLALWSPGAAASAPAAGARGRLARSASGRLAVTIPRAGIYCVTVSAVRTPPAGVGYRLMLRR